MPDYRTMFDCDYVKAWDLNGKDATVRIAAVKVGTLSNGKTKSKKPIVYFERTEKGLAINKTNGACISGMYGPNTDEWIGKLITIYPTTTTFGNATVDCIRVRPRVPSGKQQPQGVESRPGGEEQQAKKDAAAEAASSGREPGDDAEEGP